VKDSVAGGGDVLVRDTRGVDEAAKRCLISARKGRECSNSCIRRGRGRVAVCGVE